MVVATGNAHKAAEVRSWVGRFFPGVQVVSAAEAVGWQEVAETADSFRGNARLKARALRERVEAGCWVLADDSGLEVDALHGAPGVFSARYAGATADDAANRARLLAALSGVAGREGRFRSVLCLIGPDGREEYFEGICPGWIGPEERGSGGFGYDSLFIPQEGDGRTFGQMSREEKEVISHRGRALEALVNAVGGSG